MDISAIFEISASGMELQRARLEAVAKNLANTNTTKTASGQPYSPKEVVAVSRSEMGSFEAAFNSIDTNGFGVDYVEVERETTPRLVYDPAHPHANGEGFVVMPNIDPVHEMTTMMTATRAYEANVRAMNAAKTMALRALEIGADK